jgi:hypothetical protein
MIFAIPAAKIEPPPVPIQDRAVVKQFVRESFKEVLFREW